jgi:hypothetical protein
MQEFYDYEHMYNIAIKYQQLCNEAYNKAISTSRDKDMINVFKKRIERGIITPQELDDMHEAIKG